jgi:hypothetical protein
VGGTISAGFHTTVLPNAIAGASFQVGIAIGKFHGVIAVTTPSGSRRAYRNVTSEWLGYVSPSGSSVWPA